MALTRRQRRGAKGEDLAVHFLRRQGFEILERNARVGRGEIDIVARDGDTIVFVEVKTAGGQTFGPPETWITRRKRKAIVRAALQYLADRNLEREDCRFDLVLVERRGASVVTRHVKHAFVPDESDLEF